MAIGFETIVTGTLINHLLIYFFGSKNFLVSFIFYRICTITLVAFRFLFLSLREKEIFIKVSGTMEENKEID